MTTLSPERVTVLLEAARAGSREAFQQLFPLVYDQLRQLAEDFLHREGRSHTLQPTALVHEVYLKLLQQRSAGCKDRGEFFGIAAQAMRRILIDHARGRKRVKRGGGMRAVPLDEAVAYLEERAIDLLAVDEALTKLEAIDPRKAKLVELRFFAGLGAREAADALGVPLRTAERDWTVARAWLRSQLQDHGAA